VQAAELWWEGRDESLSVKLDKMAPSCFDISAALNAALVKTSSNRDGFGFRADVIERDEIADRMVFYSQWKVSMEASIAATESTARAQASVDTLKKTLVDFRGTIKNDLSSMKAASERVQSEVLQMRDKYKQAQDLLTSPEFVQAIENAERMAKALESIQHLTETKISVAVFSGGKQ
jgi:quinol monooxygenase YgiN